MLLVFKKNKRPGRKRNRHYFSPCGNKQHNETSQWTLNMMKQINSQLRVIQSQ